jgi:enoyl-CoA hydratase
MNKTLELANKIAGKGQQAVRLALKAVRATHQMGLAQGLNYEASLFALVCGTEDFKEGTAAFLDKRKPDFKNK